jgi:hypothetical protein
LIAIFNSIFFQLKSKTDKYETRAAFKKAIDDLMNSFIYLAMKQEKHECTISALKMITYCQTIVKSLVSYNKADQDKIAKGEKPTYSPSVWIKLFHNNEKGFDGKITSGDNKPITNTDDILNKDLNINNIEIYSRHIWFGPHGTSINLTMNKCSIVYETTEYDMDDATGNDEDEEDQEKAVEEETADEDEEEAEVVNSDSNE